MKPPSACRFLNNKAYFFAPVEQDAENPDSPEPQPLSTPFWCLETHEPVGPDGDDVSDECCGPHRGCYRPEVEL